MKFSCNTQLLVGFMLLTTGAVVSAAAGLRVDEQDAPVVVSTMPSVQWDYSHPSNTVVQTYWAMSNAVPWTTDVVTATCSADVNRDGRNEVVVFTASGTNYTYTMPTNEFQSNVLKRFNQVGINGVTMWIGPPAVRSADVADFNNDGWLDFVVGRDNLTNMVLFGSVSGTNYVAVPFGKRPRSTAVVRARDINRDGYADILVVNESVERVFVYFNDQTATNWTARETLLTESTDTHDIDAADLNHDGMLEVVTVSGNSYGNFVYLNDATGTNLTPFLVLNGYESYGVRLGDVNRDGNGDIVIANGYGQRDVILIGNGSGTNFTLYDAVLSAGDDSRVVDLGDLNLDGNLDIVISVAGVAPSVVYMSAGSGIVAYTRQTIAGSVSNATALVRDINTDGANDLVLLNSAGSLAVITNLIVSDVRLVQQAAYSLAVNDIGVCMASQIWNSGVCSGTQHGAWNGAVLVSNCTRSSEYETLLTTIGGDRTTNHMVTYYTYRLSNVFCEFSGALRTWTWAQTCTTQGCTTFTISGIASRSITSIVLTNTTSRKSMMITPAVAWSTNVSDTFLQDITNRLCVIGRTAGGQLATDAITVVVTNSGIAILTPVNGSYTNTVSNRVVWRLPIIVTDPSWVRYRFNTNAWAAPDNLTSTVVALTLGTNAVQVAYATPQGVTETSQITYVMLDTYAPTAVKVSPIDMGVVNTNYVVFTYRVYDALAGLSNEVASGIAWVGFRFWRDTSMFETSLYGWAAGTNIANQYVTFPLNPLDDGTNYFWQVLVRDRAGNTNATSITRFIVAATTIYHIYPQNDLWVNTPSVNFLWSVPAFVPSNSQAYLQLNNNPWVTADSLTNTVASILPGTNQWRIKVIMPNGQALTSTATRVMLDTTPPLATLVDPWNGRYVKPGMLNFLFQVSDTGSIWRSGIQGVRFHFVGPDRDFWYGVTTWVDAPATSVYATFPYNPFTNETGLVYHWQLEVTDWAGNVITTSYATFGVDATPPSIAVMEPYAGATFTTNIRSFLVSGVAADSHGDLSIIRWANQTTASSGIATGLSAWTVLATYVSLVEGTNTLVFTAYDTAGNFTSDTMLAVLDLSPPLISFTYPAGGGLLLADGYDFDLQGIIRDIYAPVAYSSWSNVNIATALGDLTLVSNAWTVPGVLLGLPYGVTNTILVTASDIYGWTTSAMVKVVLVTGTNTIPILANWPQQIGLTQTGFIEVATISNTEYTLRLGADPGVELAAWRATSDYSLVVFTFAHQGLTAGMSPLLRLISLSNGNVATMPRPFTIVNEWALDATGRTPLREDGDEIYCRIHAVPQPSIRIEGKSIYISRLISPLKIFVRVTDKMGGDGHYTIPYIEADGPIDLIKTKGCSIDEVHAAGGVRSVRLNGGSLGYRHDKRARVCHGLLCGLDAPGKGLRDVTVSRWRGDFGEILGRIQAPVSYNGNGVKLLATQGTIQGVFMADWFDELMAYTIEDSWVYATNVGVKGYAIDSVKAAYLLDSGLTGTTNTFMAQQIFVAGMDPETFWNAAVMSNSFVGIVPQGVIRKVTGIPGCVKSHGVYIIGVPTKPVVVPKAVDRQKEYWFINGKQAPTPWNGRSIP
jgi:hypothetical protein